MAYAAKPIHYRLWSYDYGALQIDFFLSCKGQNPLHQFLRSKSITSPQRQLSRLRERLEVTGKRV